MNRYTLVISIIIALLASAAWAGEAYQAKVIGISDGDTIKVLHGKEQIKIRLYGIDTPELKGQPFSRKARRFTSNMVYQRRVTVKPVDIDRYGRTIAWVTIGGQSLNIELVKAGLAWHYKKYSSDKILAEQEAIARRNMVGLWADPNPTPPWEFRRK